MASILTLIITLFISSFVLAEGTLYVQPIHDFTEGNGATVILESDFKLTRRLYLLPTAQLNTLEKYREEIGTLELEYRWTDDFSTGVGTTHNRYRRYTDDEQVVATDAHLVFKYKLWK